MNDVKQFWFAPEEVDAHGATGCTVYTDFKQIPEKLKPHAYEVIGKEHYDKLLKIAVKALEYYADSDDYLDHDPDVRPGKAGYGDHYTPNICDDAGSTAREALDEIATARKANGAKE